MGAPTEHGATGKCDAWMIVDAALVGHFPQVFPRIEEKAEIGMRFSRHFCFSWEVGNRPRPVSRQALSSARLRAMTLAPQIALRSTQLINLN